MDGREGVRGNQARGQQRPPEDFAIGRRRIVVGIKIANMRGQRGYPGIRVDANDELGAARQTQ